MKNKNAVVQSIKNEKITHAMSKIRTYEKNRCKNNIRINDFDFEEEEVKEKHAIRF